MTARVYWGKAWAQARDLRASRGKAPRLAVRRAIVLRQGSNGHWVAGIHEWRFGAWKPPTWLCGWESLPEARKAALEAWDRHKIPLLWAYHDERGLRPFFTGLNEPCVHPLAVGENREDSTRTAAATGRRS